MKKIKYFLMSVFLVSLASCNDATDIVQDGELGNDVTFQTVSDMEKYLYGGVYTNLSNSAEIAFTAEFTDECSIGVSNGGQAIDLHRFNLNASTDYPSTIWLQQYLLINRANRLIEAAAKITPVVDVENDIDETPQYNDILAQAKTLRAYAYIQLVSYFSTNPADDSALGVMLLDFVPKVTDKFPRVSNGEIYALVESDLAFASANILSQTPAAGYKFISKSMINAMYARMYLYRKNYPLAKQYAQAVINTSGLTLSAPLVYRQMWADTAAGEIIFAASRPNAGTWGNIASTFYFNTTDANGGAFLEMGRNLFNLYHPTDDIRRVAFVDPSKIVDASYLTNPAYLTSDVLPIDKYPGKGNTPLRNDLKIFRLTEMYFILAECAASEGDLNGVAGYIKNVRDARFSSAQPLPSYANVTAAWADIMLERRKELAFEGFRYLDIKRLGVLANQSIDRNITDDVILSLPTTIPNTDHRFTLPIPQDEIAASGSIMEQNPNY